MFTQPVHQHPTRYRVLGVAAAIGAAAALFAGTAAPAAAGAPAEPLPTQYYTPCSIDSAYLPQTPDAATSWLTTCYEVDQLPHTADAIEAWLR